MAKSSFQVLPQAWDKEKKCESPTGIEPRFFIFTSHDAIDPSSTQMAKSSFQVLPQAWDKEKKSESPTGIEPRFFIFTSHDAIDPSSTQDMCHRAVFI